MPIHILVQTGVYQIFQQSPFWQNVALRSVSIGVIIAAVFFIWGWLKESDLEANIACSILLGIFIGSSCYLFLRTPFFVAFIGSALVFFVCGAIAGMGGVPLID
jgi:hypothetical protein